QPAARVLQGVRLMTSPYPGSSTANITLKWSSQDFQPLGHVAELLFQTNTLTNRVKFNRPTYGAPAKDTNRAEAAAAVVQGVRPRPCKGAVPVAPDAARPRQCGGLGAIPAAARLVVRRLHPASSSRTARHKEDARCGWPRRGNRLE